MWYDVIVENKRSIDMYHNNKEIRKNGKKNLLRTLNERKSVIQKLKLIKGE